MNFIAEVWAPVTKPLESSVPTSEEAITLKFHL